MQRPLHRRRALAAIAVALACAPALAHEAHAGDIAIVHPFATPTIPGTTTGAAYFARIENNGAAADRLVAASTPAAERVEIHTMAVDAQGVMRMRETDAIALAPKAALQMRPGAGMHLMLVGLKGPLKEGARFPMKLRFERAGTVEIEVVVERAPARDTAPAAHSH